MPFIKKTYTLGSHTAYVISWWVSIELGDYNRTVVSALKSTRWLIFTVFTSEGATYFSSAWRVAHSAEVATCWWGIVIILTAQLPCVSWRAYEIYGAHEIICFSRFSELKVCLSNFPLQFRTKVLLKPRTEAKPTWTTTWCRDGQDSMWSLVKQAENVRFLPFCSYPLYSLNTVLSSSAGERRAPEHSSGWSTLEDQMRYIMYRLVGT